MTAQNPPRHVFCSFGDSRMHGALERIRNQAEAMGVFDEIHVHDESGLTSSFLNAYGNRLVHGSRGFGYWIWKPQIILQTMEVMDEGDRLLFTDVGCHLNPGGVIALREYFDRAADSSSGMLFTRLQEELIEKRWTKGDVFDHFSCRDNNMITDTPQLQSGILFFEKKPATMTFLRNWADGCLITRLVDDSPSTSPNFPGFRMNRHDQSVLSVLAKLAGAETVDVNNFITRDDWSLLKDQPIWIRRDKGIVPGIMARILGPKLLNRLVLLRRKILHR